jgi:hypothetical protein
MGAAAVRAGPDEGTKRAAPCFWLGDSSVLTSATSPQHADSLRTCTAGLTDLASVSARSREQQQRATRDLDASILVARACRIRSAPTMCRRHSQQARQLVDCAAGRAQCAQLRLVGKEQRRQLARQATGRRPGPRRWWCAL